MTATPNVSVDSEGSPSAISSIPGSIGAVASPGRIDMEAKFALFVVVLIATGYAGHLALDAQHTGLAATIAAIVVIAVVASGFARYALFKPIHQLLAAARAVQAGDFTRRLRFDRRDEIGNLAIAMDALCDQLEAAELASHAHLVALDQLRHSDRIATLGRLASSVAHELGNPLSVIELRAQLITSGDADSLHKARVNAAVIVEQAHRMTGILDQILSFARMQPAKITRLDLGNLLRKAIALSEHTSKKHKTQIALEVPPTAIELDGDSNKLLQVVINLIVNGIQAMPNGGTLDVIARDEQRSPLDDPSGPPCDFVCIDVIDHGTGIAPHLQPQVFEPFFSTKSSEGGTGLGLSVAQGIAHEHDGWITVESELGSGSSFKVHLPRRRSTQGEMI
ncbi:MAG TPA: ATP-binding protein [Polyangiales bacterium]|nr:ATP-binding protein [Polyangiales bacterium]